MTTLVVCCHPDDEALWCAGYLMAHPGTHVACCCIDTRKIERTYYFYKACESLGAVPFVVAGEFDMWGLDTRPIEAFASTYDRIITHNEKGEYGHPAHIKLHHAMGSLGKPMQVFNYGITLGEPIDYERKIKALECYHDPMILPWLKNKFAFDFAHETLLDR
jgi:hypothetical protein